MVNTVTRSLTLAVLRVNKRLDERVSCLGVEGQGVVEGLQLRRLVEERVLETFTVAVEVLLDSLECALQHCALLGSKVTLEVLRDVLW